MSKLPLYFSHGGLVAGDGFLAHVNISGRCLQVNEDEGGVCLYGVNPGGIFGVGETMSEARGEFLESIRLAVFDLAIEATDFEDFKMKVLGARWGR